MVPRSPFVRAASFLAFTPFFLSSLFAQDLAPLCQPKVTGPVIVVTHEQTIQAGLRAQPPVTGNGGGFGFAWPDTQMGVIKTPEGYEFFGSDGGLHLRQLWEGHWVGNNNYGSVVTTLGTLDNPLGTGNPIDVTISPNPDPGVNPNFSTYGYIGGGGVYQVPAGMVGAGNLLVGYHAELPDNFLYAVYGLAASSDNGLHWTDLGEVIRPNQSFAPHLPGFDPMGASRLVLSPDGQYFYFYYNEWPAGTSVTTRASVARARVSSVLEAAFGSSHPHMVPFEKFYRGTWNLQPGSGGASSELFTNPNTQPYTGYLEVHFNSALQRYVMITSDDTNFAYYESIDGLHWTAAQFLGAYGDPNECKSGTIAPYPFAVGLGDDPSILGSTFYVYYLHLGEEGGSLPRICDSLRRLTLTCQ